MPKDATTWNRLERILQNISRKMVLHKKPGAEEPRAVCRRAPSFPPSTMERRESLLRAPSRMFRHRSGGRKGLLTSIQESNSKREEGCRFNLPSQKSRRRRRVTLSDLRPWELFVVLPRDNFFGGATVSLAEFYGFFGGETDNSFLPSKVPQSH